MEAQPLTSPPFLMERAVQFLIPPAARETVVGDLREIYGQPLQYAAEAVRTVPLVIMSCAIRAVNFPLLILKGALVFFCLEAVSGRLLSLSPAQVALGTAGSVIASLLHDTYRQVGRPSARRSIIEAMLMAGFIIAFCPEALGVKSAAFSTADSQLELQLTVILLLVIPALGILRTALVIHGDRELESFADDMSDDTLPRYHAAFLRRLRIGYLVEALAFLAFAVAAQIAFHFGPWLLGIYILVALFLLTLSRPMAPRALDTAILRLDLRRQFRQQENLRQFLSWLWAAPALAAIYEHFIRVELLAGRGVLVMMGTAAAISIYFLAASINRECTGRAQEKIDLLERRR